MYVKNVLDLPLTFHGFMFFFLNQYCSLTGLQVLKVAADPPRHITLDLNDLHGNVGMNGTLKMSNGNMYNGVVVSDGESDSEVKPNIQVRDSYSYSTGNRAMGVVGNRKLPELPKTPESTGTCIICVFHDYLLKQTNPFIRGVFFIIEINFQSHKDRPKKRCRKITKNISSSLF